VSLSTFGSSRICLLLVFSPEAWAELKGKQGDPTIHFLYTLTTRTAAVVRHPCRGSDPDNPDVNQLRRIKSKHSSDRLYGWSFGSCVTSVQAILTAYVLGHPTVDVR
jgi:hypothetical protein